MTHVPKKPQKKKLKQINADDVEKVIDANIFAFEEVSKEEGKIFYKKDSKFYSAFVTQNKETGEPEVSKIKSYGNLDSFEDFIFKYDKFKSIRSKFGKIKRWSEIIGELREKEYLNNFFD